MDTDKILEQFGLKYEDLNTGEKDQLNIWSEQLNKNQLTVQSIRDHLHVMRDAVEQDLTKTDNGTKQDMFLKARLRNYMLLEAFLSSPEKAKQAIERQLAGIVKNKGVI